MFKDKIGKSFVITAEFNPEKGTRTDHLIEKALILKDKVDAINVTDNLTACVRLSSLGLSHLLVEKNIEPIFQITCRDRNRIAIQSELLSAHALGIRNVLALTGDHPTFGDHKEAKPVFDVDSVQLLDIIDRLNKGFDLAGNKLDGSTNLFAGAALNMTNLSEMEMIKVQKKTEKSGFFQTQVVYDIESMEKFIEIMPNIAQKIIAGIMPLKSEKMANYLNKNVPGIFVPERLIDKIRKSANPIETGKQNAIEIIDFAKKNLGGVHLMMMGDVNATLEMINAI